MQKVNLNKQQLEKIVKYYILKGYPLIMLLEKYHIFPSQYYLIVKTIENYTKDIFVDEPIIISSLNNNILPSISSSESKKKMKLLSSLKLLFNNISPTDFKRRKALEDEIKNIKEELIFSNLKMINICIKYLFNGLPISLEELQMQAIEAVLKAADNYETSRFNYGFSSYICVYIMNDLKESYKKIGDLPIVDYYDKVIPLSYVSSIEHANQQNLKTDLIDYDEEELDNEIEYYDQNHQFPIEFEDYTELDEQIDDLERSIMPLEEKEVVDLDSGLFYSELKAVMEDIFSSSILSPRYVNVLKLRYGFYEEDPLNLKEIGKRYNVTNERIRQIESKCLRILRHPKIARYLREFFFNGQLYKNFSIYSDSDLKDNFSSFVINLFLPHLKSKLTIGEYVKQLPNNIYQNFPYYIKEAMERFKEIIGYAVQKEKMVLKDGSHLSLESISEMINEYYNLIIDARTLSFLMSYYKFYNQKHIESDKNTLKLKP